MESKWHSELPDAAVFGYARRVGRMDWCRIGCWLLGLSFCVVFWVLLGLTLSGIDY